MTLHNFWDIRTTFFRSWDMTLYHMLLFPFLLSDCEFDDSDAPIILYSKLHPLSNDESNDQSSNLTSIVILTLVIFLAGLTMISDKSAATVTFICPWSLFVRVYNSCRSSSVLKLYVMKLWRLPTSCTVMVYDWCDWVCEDTRYRFRSTDTDKYRSTLVTWLLTLVTRLVRFCVSLLVKVHVV